MQYKQADNVFCHSHHDWSCQITDPKLYGSEALTLFPQDCRELGNTYEVSIVGIVSKRVTPREVTEKICSYEQINTVMLIDQIDLNEKTAFKIQLTAKHFKMEKDILKLSSRYCVPVKFICFSNGHEVFTIKPRRPELNNNFFESLSRIGRFEKPASSMAFLLGDPLEYFYYYLLRAVGIKEDSQIQLFNALRDRVIVDCSLPTEHIEYYSKLFEVSPRSLAKRFWKTYWQIVPAVAALNALNGNQMPPIPQSPVEGRGLAYVF